MVYTDDAKAYSALEKIGFEHESVKHSVGEYVNEQAHINGMESFWSCLKRGYYGVYHKMSFKHLQKYADEFSKVFSNLEMSLKLSLFKKNIKS